MEYHASFHKECSKILARLLDMKNILAVVARVGVNYQLRQDLPVHSSARYWKQYRQITTDQTMIYVYEQPLCRRRNKVVNKK